MADLIDRQAAIEAVDDIESEVADGDGFQYAKWREYFCDLPSAQPEPCEDAVSRKLMYELGATCMARRDENGELVALGRLDMLPSVQPEPKWIPCSERLPEEHKMVLICKQKRNHPFIWTRETEQIDVAWRDIEGRSGDTMWLTRYFEWIHDDKVIAWMPLPEPYKEGEQDG